MQRLLKGSLLGINKLQSTDSRIARFPDAQTAGALAGGRYIRDENLPLGIGWPWSFIQIVVGMLDDHEPGTPG